MYNIVDKKDVHHSILDLSLINRGEELKNKIQYFRESINMSQEELALKVEITRSYLSDIESNKRNPVIQIVLRIAKQLNKSI